MGPALYDMPIPAPLNHERFIMKLNFLAAVLAIASLTGVAAQANPGLTREQVQAEYFAALRAGDIPVYDNDRRPRDLNPSAYPQRATPAGKTRAEVQAELAEAIRMGDIPVHENGRTARELNPSAYPARPAVMGKTREQVRAELAEAVRTGDIIGNSELGLKLYEMYPDRYKQARMNAAQEVCAAESDGAMKMQ